MPESKSGALPLGDAPKSAHHTTTAGWASLAGAPCASPLRERRIGAGARPCRQNPVPYRLATPQILRYEIQGPRDERNPELVPRILCRAIIKDVGLTRAPRNRLTVPEPAKELPEPRWHPRLSTNTHPPEPVMRASQNGKATSAPDPPEGIAGAPPARDRCVSVPRESRVL